MFYHLHESDKNPMIYNFLHLLSNTICKQCLAHIHEDNLAKSNFCLPNLANLGKDHHKDLLGQLQVQFHGHQRNRKVNEVFREKFQVISYNCSDKGNVLKVQQYPASVYLTSKRSVQSSYFLPNQQHSRIISSHVSMTYNYSYLRTGTNTFL